VTEPEVSPQSAFDRFSQRPKKQSFEEFLISEFEKRKLVNPRYSLRAFASHLKTDVSQLSKVIRGTRRASGFMIEKFGQILNLTTQNIDEYKLISKLKGKYRESDSANLHYQVIPQNCYEFISDFRHTHILGLVQLKTFEPSIAKLAKVLRATESEVAMMVERLEQLGLLEVKNDKWTVNTWNITYWPNSNLTSDCHRKNQDQVLKLAQHALHHLPIEKRDQSSMMMLSSESKIQEAKKRIKEFRRDLCAFMEDTDEKNVLYELSVSLFPLDD
jgi:uncharacterized protein (TIGR02147 family)